MADLWTIAVGIVGPVCGGLIGYFAATTVERRRRRGERVQRVEDRKHAAYGELFSVCQQVRNLQVQIRHALETGGNVDHHSGRLSSINLDLQRATAAADLVASPAVRRRLADLGRATYEANATLAILSQYPSPQNLETANQCDQKFYMALISFRNIARTELL